MPTPLLRPRTEAIEMKRIPNGGNPDARLFIIIDRPSWHDARTGTLLSSEFADEFWARLEKMAGVVRDDCYVAAVCPYPSNDPLTDEEVRIHEPQVLVDLSRIRPVVVVTVGPVAARWACPEWASLEGDHFYGLALRAPERFNLRRAALVAVVSPAAALGQPSRYQVQLSRDLAMVGRVLRDGLAPWRHRECVPPARVCGLAGLLAGGDVQTRTVGCDTEGSLTRPWTVECISLSGTDGEGSVIETFQRGAETPALPHIQTIFDTCDRLAIHNADHDAKGLMQLGLSIPWRKVDDTMVMAWMLGYPKGLKDLMRRRHQWTMNDYAGLVLPLDDAAVREVLTHAETVCTAEWSAYEQARKAAKKARKLRLKGKPAERVTVPAEPGVPKRALTSIRKMLTTEADKRLRDRWEDSTFAPSVPLPPHKTWKDLDYRTRTDYALIDALGHRVLRDDLWQEIQANGLEDVYRIDMGVLPLLVRNEMVGLQCDRKKLERLSAEFQAEYDQTVQEIRELAGRDVNPRSGDQVADCLFNELGITPTKRTSTGQFTTADKYLKARRREHAIIQKVLDARQLGKYIGTYTAKLPRLLQQGPAGEWRYFPDWMYTGTDTGRLAEKVIILIPKHDPLAKTQGRRNRAKRIRNAFHAGPGRVLVSVDLSQIELRMMAHLSQDPVLLKVFRDGRDPHAETAFRLLGAPREKKAQDDSAHRLPAKTVNFGIINGMTEFGMLDQLHEAGQLQWTREKVADLLDGWWNLHKGVEKYWDREIEHAIEHGWIREALFGRRRLVHSIWSTDDRVYTEAKRQCLFGIQSASDTVSKVWNIAIEKHILRPRRRKGEYAELWVRVHDDTTVEVEEGAAEQVKADMLGLVPQLLDIPTPAEGKIAERWGDL